MRCSIIANEIFLKLVVVLTFWIHLRVDYLTFASSSVSIDEQQELTSAQWLHEHMPALGFGTAGLQVDTTRATLMALRSGCKMIDTAQAVEWYDEAAVGEAIKLYKSESNNSHIYVVTKIHPRSFEERKMRDRLTQSRSNLFRGSDSSSDVLDAVLLHAPWCWRNHCTEEEERVHWRTGWYNLEQLQDEFMILKLGVSNFDIKLLKELTLSVANRKVAVIQVRKMF